MDPAWAPHNNPEPGFMDVLRRAAQAGATNLDDLLRWLRATGNTDILMWLEYADNAAFDSKDDQDTILRTLVTYSVMAIATEKRLGYFRSPDIDAEHAWQALVHLWEQQGLAAQYQPAPAALETHQEDGLWADFRDLEELQQDVSFIREDWATSSPKLQPEQIAASWHKLFEYWMSVGAVAELQHLVEYLKTLATNPTEAASMLHIPEFQQKAITVIHALEWEAAPNEATAFEWWADLRTLAEIIQTNAPSASTPQAPQSTEPPRRSNRIAARQNIENRPPPQRNNLVGDSAEAPPPAHTKGPGRPAHRVRTARELPPELQEKVTYPRRNIEELPFRLQELVAAVAAETEDNQISISKIALLLGLTDDVIAKRLKTLAQKLDWNIYASNMLDALRFALRENILRRPTGISWPPAKNR